MTYVGTDVDNPRSKKSLQKTVYRILYRLTYRQLYRLMYRLLNRTPSENDVESTSIDLLNTWGDIIRKKYPSQIRYEENNPTITFRVTKAEKELIERIAKLSKRSVSTLVRIKLLDLGKEITSINNQLKNDADKQAKEKYALLYPCSICGLMLTIRPNSKCHNDIKQYLKENGWRHADCVNKIKK